MIFSYKQARTREVYCCPGLDSRSLLLSKLGLKKSIVVVNLGLNSRLGLKKSIVVQA